MTWPGNKRRLENINYYFVLCIDIPRLISSFSLIDSLIIRPGGKYEKFPDDAPGGISAPDTGNGSWLLQPRTGNSSFRAHCGSSTVKRSLYRRQQCVFLVTIDDYEPSDNQPVKISAMATGTQITIENADIIEGQVAEIIVIPAQSAVNQVIEMEITGTRGKTSQQEKIAFEVVEGEDDRAEYATGIRDRFINWLKTSHPELGISGDTEWNGTMVSPQWLIVSHYLFLSDEWEMHVSWHIMIAPYDWAKIDLRHRFDESAPSYAFEISSLSNNTQPAAVEIPEEVWR
jgi:hypothetical protein